jgi:lipoprotein NlpD
VVRPQDTLYSIAWRHDLDFRDLAKWNHIGSDYRVSIGQVLVLSPGAGGTPPAPVGSSRAPHARDAPRVGSPTPLPDPTTAASADGSSAPGAASSRPGAGGTVQGDGVSAEAAVGPGKTGAAASSAPAASRGKGGAPRNGVPKWVPPAAPMVGGNLKWVWPTERLSAPVQVPGGGILLLGRLGQDIRAAGAGRVVYTGSGLRGYGNLIIIKHGDSLLSSYAHNREMLVHDGQDVAAGQIIAHMGTGAHQVSALYFEIRVNGRPTDPLRYLAAGK